jgi:DNA-directed RNA polymerase specialized sigma24 family protein
MSDTEQPIRQRGLADECLALATLRDKYYRPLVRLAALLTGDADTAEAVVCDVLTALRPRAPIDPDPSEEVLLYLQQRVLARTRRIRCHGPTATDFTSLPVVRALQGLPRRGREAVVLTLYLDLSEHEAAHVAGVTPTALHQSLSEAMRALKDRFTDA